MIPIGLYLYYKLRSYYVGRHRLGPKVGGKNEIAWEEIVIEFITLIVPMLVVQTSLLPYLSGPLVLFVCMMLLASLIPTKNCNDDTATTSLQQQSTTSTQNRRPAFLSIHRSCVYILTTIAILAVDFPIFPRRFCKTEVGGYGWMDLGAASFIIIAGWTSALSAAGARESPSLKTTNHVCLLLRRAIKKCAPLLLLGLIRLATNKGLEYQEHVSEYGVHWNFFFTLCCVEGFMVAWKGIKNQLGYPFTTEFDGILALMMMIPYQLFLSIGGGQDFIENGDRRCSEAIRHCHCRLGCSQFHPCAMPLLQIEKGFWESWDT